MPIYYGELYSGHCTLFEARNLQQAWSTFAREEGTNNARGVRKASKEDIEWVRGMGGYVPPTPGARR